MNILQYLERILWATRMASLTSPTYVGGYMPHDEASRLVASDHAGEIQSSVRDQEDAYLANAY